MKAMKETKETEEYNKFLSDLPGEDGAPDEVPGSVHLKLFRPVVAFLVLLLKIVEHSVRAQDLKENKGKH